MCKMYETFSIQIALTILDLYTLNGAYKFEMEHDTYA